MRKIQELSRQFRNAIEEAYGRGEFRKFSLYSHFPNECCDLTCDLLGQFLFENGIDTFQINGIYKFDEQRRHVWLMTFDDTVIDITGDQLENVISSIKEIPQVYVGNEGELYREFFNERNVEENTIFTDPKEFNGFGGCPDERQKTLIKLYEIICQYL